MKKCLHLKKTKPHWRRKPPKVMTWRERVKAEKHDRERERLRGMRYDQGMLMGVGLSMAAMELAGRSEIHMTLDTMKPVAWRPIGSAPKDGTWFLAGNSGEEDIQIIRYWENGWWNGDYTYDADDFDSWMPLPEPPK